MACYSPLKGYRDKSGAIVFSARKGTDVEVTVPCYTCVGCRIARTRMWALRLVHESKLHDRNMFVTLTYDEAHIPPHRSLRYADVQAFHKRLRHVAGPFRFFAVGEYGENFSRPHYHVCYFGIFPADARKLQCQSEKYQAYTSESMRRTWQNGHVHIGSLTYSSARYVSGYVFQKTYGKQGDDKYKRIDADGVWHPIVPEFARMSLRPGIGRDWYERYESDFRTEDVAVLDGKRFPVPKYYDVLLERKDAAALETIREDREFKALRYKLDNNPARMEAKAIVAEAGIRDKDERMRFK